MLPGGEVPLLLRSDACAVGYRYRNDSRSRKPSANQEADTYYCVPVKGRASTPRDKPICTYAPAMNTESFGAGKGVRCSIGKRGGGYFPIVGPLFAILRGMGKLLLNQTIEVVLQLELKLLRKLKRGKDENAKIKAVNGLALIGSGKSVSVLAGIIDAEVTAGNVKLKQAAARALGSIGDRRAVKHLMDALKRKPTRHEYQSDRFAYAEALIELNPTASEVSSAELGRLFDTYSNPHSQIIELMAKRKLPDAIPYLLEVAKSKLEYASYQLSAIAAIGKIGGDKAVSSLIELYKWFAWAEKQPNSDELIKANCYPAKAEAIDALGSTLTPKARGFLKGLLKDPKVPGYVKRSCKRVLGSQ